MTIDSMKPLTLQSALMKDVSPFLGTEVSVCAEIFRKNRSAFNPFAGRESALHLTVTNEGELNLTNAILEITTSENLKLMDPGAFFGVIRRHVRIPQLKPGKHIKYKLALHPNSDFESGVVAINLRSANWRENNQEFSTRLAVFKYSA
jgi:uncharacterized membrane protein